MKTKKLQENEDRNLIIITGASGLIGSECVRYFSDKGYKVLGIDNDFRSHFFGKEASTKDIRYELETKYIDYKCLDIDIRNHAALSVVISQKAKQIKAIIHTAAQPSHDLGGKIPILDFEVNATATAHLLDLYRQHCPEASFIFTSTNKVYGDTPNNLKLVKKSTRWECEELPNGIDEKMSIDHSKHSLFGASKVAADILVQEYGRYFGLNTVVFRGGCLTGPQHKGVQLHGFLSYLVKTIVNDGEYNIFGDGFQVRDNIHSYDLVRMFDAYLENPTKGEAYNAGGGRGNEVSILEAIEKINKLAGKNWKNFTVHPDKWRSGDHIWYVSDLTKFKTHYPDWKMKYNVIDKTLKEMVDAERNR